MSKKPPLHRISRTWLFYHLSLSTTLSSSHCYHRLCHLSPLAALRSGADAVCNFDPCGFVRAWRVPRASDTLGGFTLAPFKGVLFFRQRSRQPFGMARYLDSIWSIYHHLGHFALLSDDYMVIFVIPWLIVLVPEPCQA